MTEEKFYIDELEDTYVIDQFKNELFKKLCGMTNARINIQFEDDDLNVKLTMYGFVSSSSIPNFKERLLTEFPVHEVADTIIKRFRAHVESAFFTVRKRGDDSN